MKAKVPSSACSDKQAHLAHRLHEAVPPGAKLALCFDPEGDLDGLNTILDNASRVWRVVTYQEDDLAFRLTMRELETHGWSADAPILLRVTMPEFVPIDHHIELSFIGDVLSRVEGQPIDLRTDAVVSFHTEPVTWPVNLQEHAPRISRDLKGFVDGYWRMRTAIGKDRPLGRHHIPAVLLLAKAKDLDYRDLELPHAYPAEVIARFLTLATLHQFDAEDEGLLWEVLQTTGRIAEDEQIKPWREFPTDECLLLLVLSGFLEAQGVQNVALSLSGLGLFSRPVHELVPLLGQVRAYLQEQTDLWQRVVQRADRVCTQDQAEKAISLLKVVVPPEQWINLVHDDTPRTVALALLLGYLDGRLLRRRNFQTHLAARAKFTGMTGRNQDAIQKTAAGLLKLLYPHRTPDDIEPEELIFCLDLAVEMRRRVADQLRVIAPKEFSQVTFQFHLNGRERSEQ